MIILNFTILIWVPCKSMFWRQWKNCLNFTSLNMVKMTVSSTILIATPTTVHWSLFPNTKSIWSSNLMMIWNPYILQNLSKRNRPDLNESKMKFPAEMISQPPIVIVNTEVSRTYLNNSFKLIVLLNIKKININLHSVEIWWIWK